jgi:hypothetical protein
MNPNSIFLALVAVATCLLPFNQIAKVIAATASTWTSSGQLNEGRPFHATVELADGRLLTMGGNYGPQRSAELYDPATRTWTLAAPMPHPVGGPAAVVLPDGRVLIAGGWDATGGAIDKTLLYDSGSNSWAPGSPLREPRRQGQVEALADGRVLLVGGDNYTAGLLDSVELYDGVSWTRGASVPYRPGSSFSLTLLTDGRVLLAGGLATAFTYLASAALYDPPTDTWERLPDMSVPRLGHSATLLLDGRVLIAGGASGGPGSVQQTTEIFNPGSKTWAPAAPMAMRRYFHGAVRLFDGRVLVAAGTQGGGPDGQGGELREAEVFYPQFSGWAPVAPMQHYRYAHTLTLLRDGTALAVGGVDQIGPGPPLLPRETELFTPGDDEPPPPDTTPPVVACSVEPAVLWPVTNQLVPVTVTVDVKDNESGAAGFSLLAAVADEGAATDIVDFTIGTADTAGSLRASRDGRGDGRTYSLVYEGRDVAGNSDRCTVTVVVPHDQR